MKGQPLMICQARPRSFHRYLHQDGLCWLPQPLALLLLPSELGSSSRWGEELA